MGTPFIGEIRLFAGNFAPNGWSFCDGSILPISENETLFTLIGTTYGGDGQETFALPDLQSRVPIHWGPGPGLSARQLAEAGGAEEVTLTVNQIPSHAPTLQASSRLGNANQPAGRVLAQQPSVSLYRQAAPDVSMGLTSITPVGGSQPHTNLQPYLCLNFIISLFGIYPTPT